MITSVLELKNDAEVKKLLQHLKTIEYDIEEKVDFVMKKTGCTLKESTEYCICHSVVLWSYVYINWTARKYQETILEQGKIAKKLVLRLGRRLGKCLPGDVLIQDSKTGERKTVKELYNNKCANVFSINNNEKLVANSTNVIFENGIKKVYELTTKNGRVIRATDNHPFYTPTGYIELGDLKSGDSIAIACNYQPTNPIDIDYDEIKQLANEILYKKDVNSINDKIFKAKNKDIASFLSLLYNSQTSVFNEDGLILTLKSQNILKEIQSLLLRFGIDSRFFVQIIDKNKEYYARNSLIIPNNYVYRFLKSVGINEKIINIALQAKYITKSIKNKDTNIIWDKVKSIKYIKEEMTYDLTVPTYHNFVANDFITHNTECMCILILWYGYTQSNKGPNNQYTILIITPYETQIDLIFDRLHQLIDLSPLLKGMVTRDIYHRIEFSNGTIIKGLTASSKSGTGAASTRGEHADILILDEIDYMTSADVTNIYNIRNEAPERIKIIVASTPSGKHEEFYKWCIGASYKFIPKKEDIDSFTFSNFEYKTDSNGNGWTEVYAPSVVNEELIKVNPDTGITYLEEIKNELSELRYVQEVMAEFGEEELGVYQRKYIEEAIRKGNLCDHRYTTEMSKAELDEFLKNRNHGIRILGIDWDKTQAGTNMVCLELDTNYINEHGIKEPVFKVLFRIEIERNDFTYSNALDTIIKLNEQYNFDHIALDRGYGEVQLELLKKYGIENPQTGLAEKTVGYQFSEKIEVRDPYTHKKDKKPLKPFMVNNSVIVFERGKILFNPKDTVMHEQFYGYKIKSISSSGLPIYTDEDEHIVDALNLCLLSFEQNYGELFKKVVNTRVKLISGITTKEENTVKPRLSESQYEHTDPIVAKTNTGRIVSIFPSSNISKRKSRISTIARRSF